jgi:hypothetical protein
MKKEILKWIFLKDSWVEWKITTVMVWVHGNEVSWIEALDNIIDNIEIISGKVYFIYANLEAIKKKVRFTEKNLNRCFIKNINGNTYEENRAKEIIQILDKSDFLLDVHNMISFNSSLEVLITTHKDYIKYFQVDKIITHIDDVEKWWSDWYIDSIWWKWFCIECWSINYWDKEKSRKLAEESIINFLKVTKNINWKPKRFNKKREVIKMSYVYKTKTNNFKLKKEFKDFEIVKKNEIIWYDWWEEIKVDRDSIIIFAVDRNQEWSEWFYIWIK